MKYKLLDCVVLTHDLPEFELCTGDLGTVVESYETSWSWGWVC